MTEEMPEEIWFREGMEKDYTHAEDNGGTKYIRADLMPQWRPIETALKDGTDILVYHGHNQSVVYWDGNDWFICHEKSLRECGEYGPTYWMPLPGRRPHIDECIELIDDGEN